MRRRKPIKQLAAGILLAVLACSQVVSAEPLPAEPDLASEQSDEIPSLHTSVPLQVKGLQTEEEAKAWLYTWENEEDQDLLGTMDALLETKALQEIRNPEGPVLHMELPESEEGNLDEESKNATYRFQVKLEDLPESMQAAEEQQTEQPVLLRLLSKAEVRKRLEAAKAKAQETDPDAAARITWMVTNETALKQISVAREVLKVAVPDDASAKIQKQTKTVWYEILPVKVKGTKTGHTLSFRACGGGDFLFAYQKISSQGETETSVEETTSSSGTETPEATETDDSEEEPEPEKKEQATEKPSRLSGSVSGLPKGTIANILSLDDAATKEEKQMQALLEEVFYGADPHALNDLRFRIAAPDGALQEGNSATVTLEQIHLPVLTEAQKKRGAEEKVLYHLLTEEEALQRLHALEQEPSKESQVPLFKTILSHEQKDGSWVNEEVYFEALPYEYHPSLFNPKQGTLTFETKSLTVFVLRDHLPTNRALCLYDPDGTEKVREQKEKQEEIARVKQIQEEMFRDDSDKREKQAEDTLGLYVKDTYRVRDLGQPYYTEVADAEIRQLEQMDFSSKRLLVKPYEASDIFDTHTILSHYENLYLLQFPDQQTTARAFLYYYHNAESVEVDLTVTGAAEEQSAEEPPVLTAADNPFAMLKKLEKDKTDTERFDIALIDTGANGAERSVSVLGTETGDDNGHGTSMLETIRSIDPDARVLSIKALDQNGAGDVASVYAAIQYAMTQKVAIINLSLSAPATGNNQVVKEAIQEAVKQGIRVVGAAGNQGRNAAGYLPGQVEEAWIAGACDGGGVRLETSNYGATVDLNVSADSTSEAAAKLSGFFSAYGPEAVAGIQNRVLLFTPVTYPEDDPESLAESEDLFRIAATNLETVMNDIQGKSSYQVKPFGTTVNLNASDKALTSWSDFRQALIGSGATNVTTDAKLLALVKSPTASNFSGFATKYSDEDNSVQHAVVPSITSGTKRNMTSVGASYKVSDTNRGSTYYYTTTINSVYFHDIDDKHTSDRFAVSVTADGNLNWPSMKNKRTDSCCPINTRRSLTKITLLLRSHKLLYRARK